MITPGVAVKAVPNHDTKKVPAFFRTSVPLIIISL